MEKLLIQRFNLPSYIKDKSFADASKSINKKFEGRNDRVSMDTKQELLERLSKAQEYLKEQSNIEQSDTNQAFFGGDQESLMPGEQSGLPVDYMSLASGVLDIGQNFFGKTGIDTSGAAGEMQKQNKGGAALSGAMSGAQTGMALGSVVPGIGTGVGAGVGALVGGVASLFGANKANEDIQKANNNNALKINSQYNSNFAKGGNMYVGGGSLDDIFKITKESQDKLNDVNNSVDIFNPILKPTNATALKPNQTKLGKQIDNVLQYGKENYGNAMRYAPAVMNALQLKNLDKPEYESLDRLDNRYNKDLVDESALRNNVQQQSDNARNAITNASTGSVGATRANLLGVQANSTNALSNAMLQAENVNRGENQAEQQFNLGVDNTNLQQSNVENQINAQNKGVYDTNKSALLSQMGNDIGQIGKEQRYKQMIKDMGVCYDSRGAYICGTQERVPEGMDTSSQTNQSAYGGEMNSNSLFTSYLDKILSKKK